MTINADLSRKRVIDVRHPQYTEDELFWQEWRECYDGGPWYVERNLKKFSERETDSDFTTRKFFTPIPAYGKAAVNDIRNAIFQRLRDVIRRDGSQSYMRAVAGELGGVDNKGATMQSFFGIEVLTELLVMGRVGVYVDMPQLSQRATLADTAGVRPYVYKYAVEDILSWSVQKPEEPGAFSAVLLRDQGVNYNQVWNFGVELPAGSYTRYRLMWINQATGKVNMRLFDSEAMPLDLNGNSLLDSSDGAIIQLDLERIPFTLLDISGSILKDVYKHQVALLNLGSSDVAYALKANFPFYTEQRDMRNVGEHLKMAVSDEGTSTTSDNTVVGKEVRVGATQGRTYDLKADRPGFIHPSSEPLQASIQLQQKLEDDIRKLVNLSVQNKSGQQAISAEAMKMSDQGLEAGLSYIGLVLESAERQVAQHWAAYENGGRKNSDAAVIKYPDRYSLKDDPDRISEAKQLSELMYTVPGTTVKKELAKNIVTVLLSGKIDTDQIDEIFQQIDEAEYTTSNPDIIIRAQEAGLVGEQTASVALGFSDQEYVQARADHVDRATRILSAQTDVALQAKIKEAELAMAMGGQAALPKMGGGGGAPVEKPMENPGARGVDDLAVEDGEGEEEKEEAAEEAAEAGKPEPVRGEGKKIQKKGDTE